MDVEAIEELEEALSPEEVARALQFCRSSHRRRFIAARGILRHILARYTGQEPRDLKFSYTDRGKPSLAKRSPRQEISFNLSRSDDFALYAVSRSREVGVDLERVCSMDDLKRIANLFFSKGELVVFEASRPTDQLQAFFRIWTRKEAYLKARGLGITAHPLGFDLPIELDNVTFVDERGLAWKMANPLPPPGYVGAMVAQGDDWLVRFFPWFDNRSTS